MRACARACARHAVCACACPVDIDARHRYRIVDTRRPEACLRLSPARWCALAVHRRAAVNTPPSGSPIRGRGAARARARAARALICRRDWVMSTESQGPRARTPKKRSAGGAARKREGCSFAFASGRNAKRLRIGKEMSKRFFPGRPRARARARAQTARLRARARAGAEQGQGGWGAQGGEGRVRARAEGARKRGEGCGAACPARPGRGAVARAWPSLWRPRAARGVTARRDILFFGLGGRVQARARARRGPARTRAPRAEAEPRGEGRPRLDPPCGG